MSDNETRKKFPKTDQLRAMRERSYEARRARNPDEQPGDEDAALRRGRENLLKAQRALNKTKTTTTTKKA